MCVCVCVVNQKPALRGEFSVLKLKQSRLTRVADSEAFAHSEELQDSDSDSGTAEKTTSKGPSTVCVCVSGCVLLFISLCAVCV